MIAGALVASFAALSLGFLLIGIAAVKEAFTSYRKVTVGDVSRKCMSGIQVR